MFRSFPGAVARSVELADQLAFNLRKAKPKLPKQEVPAGHTPMSWLRHLVMEGAAERYGTREERPDAYERLEKELAVPRVVPAVPSTAGAASPCRLRRVGRSRRSRS